MRPTTYTLDDFALGQHVKDQGQPGTNTAYVGTVTVVGTVGTMVRVKLEEPLASGATAVLPYPHEIAHIDEPKVQAKGPKQSTTSDVSASNGKESGGKSANKHEVGDIVTVVAGGHDYGNVKVCWRHTPTGSMASRGDGGVENQALPVE